MCTWFSASWRCFRSYRNCLFSCIYNPQITISPTSLFSANINGNHVENHPKPWTCPLISVIMAAFFINNIITLCKVITCLSPSVTTSSIFRSSQRRKGRNTSSTCPWSSSCLSLSSSHSSMDTSRYLKLQGTKPVLANFIYQMLYLVT